MKWIDFCTIKRIVHPKWKFCEHLLTSGH